MKNVKTLFSAVALAFVSTLSFMPSAEAQVIATPVQSPSVEQVADGFAKSKVSYWQGYFSFVGVTNGVSTSVNASFTMQLVNGRWGFTAMTIGDQVLPIGPLDPLWEIPPYLAGAVTAFSLNLAGYDQTGNPVRYGYFNADTLAPNDVITVVIYLQYLKQVIPFKLTGDETSGNIGIQSSDGEYSGWYDAGSGGFVVFYDPINPPASWLVIDLQNNAVIGSLPFVGGSGTGTKANTGNGLSLVNEDNIPEFDLDPVLGWQETFQGLQMDHVITRGGTNYAGKILVAHVSNTSDYVQVFIGNIVTGSVIQVYGLQPDGTMAHVGDSTLVAGQYQLAVYNLTGYTDYKFVVIGSASDPVNGFTVQAYDTTSQWDAANPTKG